MNPFSSRAHEPHPEEFLRETRELTLRRTRVVIYLGAFIHLAFIFVDRLRIDAEHYPAAVALRAAGVALLLPLLPATRAKSAVRWAEWLGGAAFVILVVPTAAIIPLFHGVMDPNYWIQGTGIVLCILGVGLLIPFDAPKMLAIGLIALAIQLGFTLNFPIAQNCPVLIATLFSVLIATVGARELTRSRVAEFQGRRAQEDLLRARSDFVAMLTHDIKNPLGVIDGFVQMLREDQDMTPAQREELLAHMQKAVRAAITLAVDFLDTSKIEAGRFVVKTRASDVGDLLSRALSDHQAFAAQKGVTLVNDCAPDLPAVDADVVALDRVFANLLGNAIKHTPGGGTVRVVARTSGRDRIEILVEDSGEGIPAGQESRIFDRYTGAASRADSTGLGLFIARTITGAHGGTISAENREDARGARFRVVLPTAAAPS